jgi:hypothetical protein
METLRACCNAYVYVCVYVCVCVYIYVTALLDASNRVWSFFVCLSIYLNIISADLNLQENEIKKF